MAHTRGKVTGVGPAWEPWACLKSTRYIRREGEQTETFEGLWCTHACGRLQTGTMVRARLFARLYKGPLPCAVFSLTF